jgi:hypothetical protein
MAAIQGVADVSEKCCEVFGLAAVLVVGARLDALGLHVFAVEHDHVGFGMIHPDDGVKSAHAMLS